jgi:hypothetical protein
MDTTLTLDIKPGEVITIGAEKMKIELVHKSGKLARLRFSAPKETEIKLTKQESTHE